jgi:mycofactocin system FadH/OYE family oxidoreductase 1
MASLVEPVAIAGRTASSRVVFGAHETNLGRERSLGERHVAYYAARAAGGAGVVVTEVASVHASDWPYERAPLASACGPGWASIAAACRPHGTLVLAGLGHSGAQGSSAYSQSVMWAPSRVADVVSREMPMEMEADALASVVDGFAAASRSAVHSGLDGVEIDVGPFSLLRQFHSGLTNRRGDAYGADRLRLTREVLGAVRAELGPDRLLGLRLCCDELAPWAGITPEQAASHVSELAASVDLIVVVRGGPFSTSAYRPDGHASPGFNVELCSTMRRAAAGATLVALQGSVVDASSAQAALDEGACDLVEMTRAQVAEPHLVSLVRRGDAHRVRPCLLCNQACQVRDVRNPIVSCVGEPRSGHETSEVAPEPAVTSAGAALVVGSGVAGLECARVLAGSGLRVRVVERAARPGGMLLTAARLPGHERAARLVEWLLLECDRSGVTIETGAEATDADLDAARGRGTAVVLATGSRPAGPSFEVDAACVVVDAPVLLESGADLLPAGPVLVHDPVGGPVGVGVAEWLAGAGAEVALSTPDQIAGTLLARTGDLAEANTRLQRAGIRRELRSLLRSVRGGNALLEHVWTGEPRWIPCTSVVDCGHRLPEDRLGRARRDLARAGDCVAPRTALEAVLEGRRRALEVVAAESERMAS